MSPDFYEGPPMVKPPVVHLAVDAARDRPLHRHHAWVWLCNEAGQQLFWPPNVAGWDDTRWLDTSRMRARWNTVDYVLDGIAVDPWERASPTARRRRRGSARAGRSAAWGNPELRARTPRRAARLRPARRSA